MNYKNFVEGRIENIKDSDILAFHVAMGFGPWIVPVASALIFGWSFYNATSEAMGAWSVVGGIAITVGLVVAGVTTSHTATTLASAGVTGSRLTFAWALVVSYITLEILGLIALNVWDAHLEVVGIIASLMSLIVYLAHSKSIRLTEEMRQDAIAKKEAEIETRRREEEAAKLRREREAEAAKLAHELELRELEAAHAERLAKIEASTRKAIAKSQRSLSETPAETTEMSPDQQKKAILHYIAENPDTSVRLLCETLGISKATYYRRRDELVQDGHLNGH